MWRWTRATDSLPHPRGSATICLPVDKDSYQRLVQDPVPFRAVLNPAFQVHPELFPAAFAQGSDLKDTRYSVKLLSPAWAMLVGYTLHPTWLDCFLGVKYRMDNILY